MAAALGAQARVMGRESASGRPGATVVGAFSRVARPRGTGVRSMSARGGPQATDTGSSSGQGRVTRHRLQLLGCRGGSVGHPGGVGVCLRSIGAHGPGLSGWSCWPDAGQANAGLDKGRGRASTVGGEPGTLSPMPDQARTMAAVAVMAVVLTVAAVATRAGPAGWVFAAIALALGGAWALFLLQGRTASRSEAGGEERGEAATVRSKGGAEATVRPVDGVFEATVRTAPPLPFGLRLTGPGGRLDFDRVEVNGAPERGLLRLADDDTRAAALGFLGRGARFVEGTWRYRFSAPDEAAALVVVDQLLDIAHRWLDTGPDGDEALRPAALVDAARGTDDPAYALRVVLALVRRGDLRASAAASAARGLDRRLARTPFEPTRLAVSVLRSGGGAAQRAAAARTLGRRDDGPSREALARTVGDEARAVRLAVLDALDRLRSAPVHALQAAAQDDDPEIRAAVARVLAHAGEAGRPLLDVLRADRHPMVATIADRAWQDGGHRAAE